jgi:hypothetical protein
MINLMYITNDPSLAYYATQVGVNRIFVDLEILGKYERQGHKDTLISRHTIEDVGIVRAAVPQANLLVRINPFHENTKHEIESVLAYNPQMIMLPMYKTVEEVEQVARLINGRCELIPLLETKEALECPEQVCQVEGVSELYVGLNDLHLSLGLKFMFQLLSDGTVENLSKIAHSCGKKFGFGGIARVNEGLLPSQYIIGEHIRLNSNSVILSRTFHRQVQSVDHLQNDIDFANEIVKVRQYEQEMKTWTPEQLVLNKEKLVSLVEGIVQNV